MLPNGAPAASTSGATTSAEIPASCQPATDPGYSAATASMPSRMIGAPVRIATNTGWGEVISPVWNRRSIPPP